VSSPTRRLALFPLVLLLLPLELSAQHAPDPAGDGTLAQADQLYAAGESTRARAAYELVLADDPENTRAMYQLAHLLDDDPGRAIRLLRGYVAAEPQDAWGYWALARALGTREEWSAAADALAQARRLEPRDRDFMVAHADALRRAGRLRAAADALESALRVESDPAARQQLERIRAELAPSLQPRLGLTRDSDGNTLLTARLDATASVAEGVRLGVTGSRLNTRDDVGEATSWQGQIGVSWTGAPGVELEARIGAAGLPAAQAVTFSPQPGGGTGSSGSGRGAGSGQGSAGGGQPGSSLAASSASVTPLLHLRARWRRPQGLGAELRLQRAPASSSPLLLSTPVVVSDARASVDLPVTGKLYLRGLARGGRITAGSDANTRTGFGGGAVLRGSAGELGALVQRTQYARATSAPYFAPRRVEAVEMVGYLEIYRSWPLVIALDGGVGGERVTDWGVPTGSWAPAFRLWSQLSWNLGTGRSLDLELEAYDSHAGPTPATTAAPWRSGSVAVSFKTPLR
jgi:Flp pilus assembly protein TadD